MKHYKKITSWDNTARIKSLQYFRSLVQKYFFEMKKVNSEKDKLVVREEINKYLYKINDIVRKSDVQPHFSGTTAFQIASYKKMNIILNIFNIQYYNIPPQSIIDIIDSAIGIYEGNGNASLFRTINPFYWLLLFFDFVLSIPFIFIEKFGFNRRNAEESILGKLFKGFSSIIFILAALKEIFGGFHFMKEVFNSLVSIIR